MSRVFVFFGSLLIAFVMLGSDPAVRGQEKKKANTSVFSGKIVQVNVDPNTKKVDSLYVEVNTGRLVNRNVRVDDKTKFEYSGIVNKEDYAPKVGFIANVKLRPESDLAEQLKISPATAKAKKKDKT